MRLVLRLFGLVIGVLIGWQTGAILALGANPADTGTLLFVVALSVGGIGYLLGPHLSWALLRRLRERVRQASAVDLVAIGIGLAFGGLIAALLAVPLSALPPPLGSALPLIVAVVAVTVSILVTTQRKRDLIAPWLRGHDPRDDDQAQPDGDPLAERAGMASPALLVDSSVAIDGRIVDVARTGFLDGTLVVPGFVLDEIQAIADAADPGRRARGRRGLATLDRLREVHPGRVEVLPIDVPEAREVDAKLVRLAKARGLRLLTNDHNLGRVAALQGVTVLNLNLLAGALRPPVLPGEELSLRLVQEGREAGQGVGFLDDGTMVVVDGGRSLVGQTASVTVTRLLPTSAGRLVFAVPSAPARAAVATAS